MDKEEPRIIIFMRIVYMALLLLLLVGNIVPRWQNPEYFIYMEQNNKWNASLPPLRDCDAVIEYDMFAQFTSTDNQILVNGCITTNIPAGAENIWIKTANPTYYALYNTNGLLVMVGFIFAFVFLFGENFYNKIKRLVKK